MLEEQQEQKLRMPTGQSHKSIYHGHDHLEMRKFAWSQDVARRKSKPTFLLAAVSAFFAV
jgi:hypothetical protein